MYLAPEVRWRTSRRGLIAVANLDHPCAGDLPGYLATGPDRDELARFLGAAAST